MLVKVRQSNEALLRARVPGAQDQRGCPSNLFLSCAFCEQEGHLAASFSGLSVFLVLLGGAAWSILECARRTSTF